MRRSLSLNLPVVRQLTRTDFAGWWMLVLAWIAVFFAGPAQTFGVAAFVNPMIAGLEMSRSLYSGLYSVATLVGAVALMAMGRQIDRWGCRLVMPLAAAGVAAGALTMSVATGPMLVLTGFVLLRAFGQGTLNLSARTLVPQWFVRQRGRVFAVLGLASTVSLAVIPPVHERLIGWLGWRSAWRADAIVIGLVLVPLFLMLVRNRPEELGQYPDGERPTGDDVTVANAGASRGMTLNQALHTFAFWGLVAAAVVPSMILTGLSFHQISIVADKGLSSSLAALTFTVQSLTALPVIIVIGWVVERYPVRFVVLAGQVALVGAMVALLLADGVVLTMVFAALGGASQVLWLTGSDVAWPEYYGRRSLGSIRGFGFGAGMVGSALGPTPIGIAYDAFGSYTPAIAALLILPVLSAVAVWFARPPQLPEPAPAREQLS